MDGRGSYEARLDGFGSFLTWPHTLSPPVSDITLRDYSINQPGPCINVSAPCVSGPMDLRVWYSLGSHATISCKVHRLVPYCSTAVFLPLSYKVSIPRVQLCTCTPSEGSALQKASQPDVTATATTFKPKPPNGSFDHQQIISPLADAWPRCQCFFRERMGGSAHVRQRTYSPTPAPSP